MITRSDVSTYSSSSLDEAEADVVHAGAAVLLPAPSTPSSPSSAICGRMLAVEAVLAIELVDLRRDFARGPFADRLLEQPLFFGQIEIKHEARPSEIELIKRSSRDHRLCGYRGSCARA